MLILLHSSFSAEPTTAAVTQTFHRNKIVYKSLLEMRWCFKFNAEALDEAPVQQNQWEIFSEIFLLLQTAEDFDGLAVFELNPSVRTKKTSHLIHNNNKRNMVDLLKKLKKYPSVFPFIIYYEHVCFEDWRCVWRHACAATVTLGMWASSLYYKTQSLLSNSVQCCNEKLKLPKGSRLMQKCKNE